MKLIVGLGNPGKKYESTRHNVGFLMMDRLFSHYVVDTKSKSLISDTSLISEIDARWVKPQTFMNLSWDTVSALVSFYKLDPKRDILIISDDLDMEFGKVRYRSMWSHGGQNWLRDIIAKLGTNEFSRIKIGIGRDERYEVIDWVLSRFTSSEIELLETDVESKVQEYITRWLWD